MTNNTQKPAAPLTLVTAYFEVKDTVRNRTPRHYYAKMKKLLPFVNWPMVVFCEAKTVDMIKRLRGDKPTVIHATRWEEFSVWRHREILHAHNAQRHPQYNADLSLIFHEKINFVRRVIDENPYRSEMFFWCDIGLMKVTWRECWGMPRALRLSERIEWPDLQICRAFGAQVAFFGRHYRPPPAQADSVWVWGGIWGGKAAPMRRFCDAYYDFLDAHVRKHADAIRQGVAVPAGESFRFEEALFRRLYADDAARQSLNMRVFLDTDRDWIRKLKRRVNIDAITVLPCMDVGILYCLSGERFPWKRLGREVSLLGSAYLFARLAASLCRKVWRTARQKISVVK